MANDHALVAHCAIVLSNVKLNHIVSIMEHRKTEGI